jgi:hypothetical protein
VNAQLEPSKFDRPLLPVVVVIILIGCGALIREWRNAHTSAQPRRPAVVHVQAPPEADAVTTDTQPPQSPNEQ